MSLQSIQRGICSGKLAFLEGTAAAVSRWDRIFTHGGLWPLGSCGGISRGLYLLLFLLMWQIPNKNLKRKDSLCSQDEGTAIHQGAAGMAEGRGSGQVRLHAHISREQGVETESLWQPSGFLLFPLLFSSPLQGMALPTSRVDFVLFLPFETGFQYRALVSWNSLCRSGWPRILPLPRKCWDQNCQAGVCSVLLSPIILSGNSFTDTS